MISSINIEEIVKILHVFLVFNIAHSLVPTQTATIHMKLRISLGFSITNYQVTEFQHLVEPGPLLENPNDRCINLFSCRVD